MGVAVDVRVGVLVAVDVGVFVGVNVGITTAGQTTVRVPENIPPP